MIMPAESLNFDGSRDSPCLIRCRTLFERPILNSPYECPGRRWELDEHRQPTQTVLSTRRRAKFITPIPKPRE